MREEQDVNPAACTDTRLVLPVGPLEVSRMDAAVDSFAAQGATPIAYSMGKAVEDLGGSGKRVLILISDGQETCAKDPCPIAKKLADRGIDLQFNAIGLAVNSKARTQLQCIAKAGGGAYYDANNTNSLNQALAKLTQRALRPFEVAGTPVSATADPTTAPEVGPGQYRDTYDASGTPRYYTINRTPGSTVTAWVSTVVRPYGYVNSDNFTLKLQTLQGASCSQGGSLSQALKSALVYSVAVRSEHSQYPSKALPPGCAADAQLRLEVTRTAYGPASTVPVELGVAEQGAVTNRTDLPGPVDGYTGKGFRLTRRAAAQPVVGGSGFSNAPEVTAGAWSDSIAFGETTLYKVPLDYGQTLKVTASLPGNKGRLPLDLYDGYIVRVRLLSPAHVQLVKEEDPRTGGTAEHLSATSPQVRVRNDELLLPGTQNYMPDPSTASVAGDYYVVVELQPVTEGLTGVVLPLELDLAVDGTPSGQPVFAEVAASSSPPSASTAPSAAESPTSSPVAPAGSSSLGLLLAGAGIAVLLGIAGAAVALVLRRRARARRPGA